jgi:hypothetical protein
MIISYEHNIQAHSFSETEILLYLEVLLLSFYYINYTFCCSTFTLKESGINNRMGYCAKNNFDKVLWQKNTYSNFNFWSDFFRRYKLDIAVLIIMHLKKNLISMNAWHRIACNIADSEKSWRYIGPGLFLLLDLALFLPALLLFPSVLKLHQGLGMKWSIRLSTGRSYLNEVEPNISCVSGNTVKCFVFGLKVMLERYQKQALNSPNELTKSSVAGTGGPHNMQLTLYSHFHFYHRPKQNSHIPVWIKHKI